MSAVQHFLQRWSTLEITEDNALLFEEHLFGVRSYAPAHERSLLDGLTRNTTRTEFAKRFAALQTHDTKKEDF
jgi:hypothetical protein